MKMLNKKFISILIIATLLVVGIVFVTIFSSTVGGKTASIEAAETRAQQVGYAFGDEEYGDTDEDESYDFSSDSDITPYANGTETVIGVQFAQTTFEYTGQEIFPTVFFDVKVYSTSSGAELANPVHYECDYYSLGTPGVNGTVRVWSATKDGGSATLCDVGTYTFYVKYYVPSSYSSTYQFYEYTDTITITAKPLTANSTVSNKVYDGTTTAAVTKGILSGVVAGDNVDFAASGTFADKNAGTSKNVTITYTLSGTDAGNYSMANKTVTASITAKEITLDWGNTVLAHKNIAQAPTPKLPSGGISIYDTYYMTLEVSGEGTDMGDYTATASLRTSDATGHPASNYTITNPTQPFTIGWGPSNYSEAQEYCNIIEVASMSMAKYCLAVGFYDPDDPTAAPTKTAAYDGKPHYMKVFDSYSLYNGSPSGVPITVNSCDFRAGTDSSLPIINNYTNVGDFYISGSVTVNNVQFSFTNKSALRIQQKEVNLEWDTELMYNGIAQTPTATVSNLEDGDECEVTVVGSGITPAGYEARATGLSNPNYKLPEDATTMFTIDPYEITSENTYIASIHDYKYTGKAIEPAVKVTNDDFRLVKDVDYTVEYSDNVEAGTAVVTVTGIGNYSGSVTDTFVILEPASPSPAVTVDVIEYEYDGKETKANIIVKYGDTVLTEGIDYKLTYTNNLEEGTAIVTVSDILGGEGSMTFTVQIEKTETPPSEGKKGNAGLGFAIGFPLAILVLAVIVVIVVLLRQRKNKDNQ